MEFILAFLTTFFMSLEITLNKEEKFPTQNVSCFDNISPECSTIETCLPLAKKGNADAQLQLGLFYETGKNITRDHEQAVRWYLKASKQVCAIAQHNLDLLIDEGITVKQNSNDVWNRFFKSAQQGNSKAQTYIGVLYATGRYTTQNYKEAYNWWLKSAKQNNLTAQYNLGMLYEMGNGIEQDNATAFAWYSISADQGFKPSGQKVEYLTTLLDAPSLKKAQALAKNILQDKISSQ